MVDDLPGVPDDQPPEHAPSALPANGDQVWRRSSHRVHRVLSGQVVVAASGQQTMTLTGMAAAMWIAMDQPGTAGEFVERLAAADSEVAVDVGAVREALEALSEIGIIERAYPDQSAAPQ